MPTTESVAPPPVQTAPAESSLPYVLPFAAFMVLLGVAPYLTALGEWEYLLRPVVLAVILLVFSRQVIDLRVSRPISGVLIGVAVFFLWIGPDVLIPGYRDSWLFQNSIMGHIKDGIAAEHQTNALVLATRSLRAIIIVPIIEELFWRAWLMRWLINPSLRLVPMGAFSWSSLLITAVMFGSEHGPYWDVGLVTGIIYNLWMVRTKRLGDLVLVHAVTNACLSAYVLLFQKWQYWP